MSRGEKAAVTYQALMESAARIVGEIGYAATTIARVTEAAGVAHGTFYNYFEDRQSLFDALLPYVGQQMTDYITTQLARDNPSGLAREAARFRAYCSWLTAKPGFYRVLYEAEVFAPAAHRVHVARMRDGYLRALRRAIAEGHARPMTDTELEAVAAILLGARAYIAMLYRERGAIPEAAIKAYVDLMRGGLFLSDFSA